MSYITMGDEMPSGEWVWQRTDIVISGTGRVKRKVLRNGKASEACAQSMTVADVDGLLRSVARELEGIPAENGRLATDSDSGVIRFQTTTGTKQIRFEGLHRSADEFSSIYKAIDMILGQTGK